MLDWFAAADEFFAAASRQVRRRGRRTQGRLTATLEADLAEVEAEIDEAERFITSQLNGQRRGDIDLMLALLRQIRILAALGRAEEAQQAMAAVDEVEPLHTELPVAVVFQMFTPQVAWDALTDQEPDEPESVVLEDWRDMRRGFLGRVTGPLHLDWPWIICGQAISVLQHGHTTGVLRGLDWASRRVNRRFGKADPRAVMMRGHRAQGYFLLASSPARFGLSEVDTKALTARAQGLLEEWAADTFLVFGPGHPLTVHSVTLLIQSWRETEPELRLPIAVMTYLGAVFERHALSDTRHRFGWRQEHADLFEYCVRQAVIENRIDLAIELVELERSQGLPGSGRYASQQHSSLAVDLGAFVRVFAEVPHLQKAHAALVQHVELESPQGDPIDLRQWARDITAAPNTWVWGWWESATTRVSYLLYEEESENLAYASSVPLGHDDTAEAFVREQRRRTEEPVSAHVARAAFTRSTLSERQTLARVGRDLIPERLRQRVMCAVRDEELVALVALPSAACSRIPLGALGIESAEAMSIETSDGLGDTTRLVEGAQIVVAPGVQFTAAARPGRSPKNRGTRVVTCVAAQPKDHPLHLAFASLSVPAAAESTPGNGLRTHLCDGPEAPRLFVFSGHALPGERDRPGAACLVLDGGFEDATQRIHAAEILNWPRGNGPRRVLLAACSTWGDAGAAEWLGLGPALIWLGAQSVVATMWPILDSEETAAQHVQLADELAGSDDPAGAIRRLQLRGLNLQRRAPYLPSGLARDPQDLVDSSSAYVWGSYTALGA